MLGKVSTILLATLCYISTTDAAFANCKPAFVGRIVSEWLPDGRSMRLIEPFGFVDSKCRSWEVPSGAVVDGASIPQALWGRFRMGGPFEGRYRDASVIHDWYCDLRLMLPSDVHYMFFEAMITSGVNRDIANQMYLGVKMGGPKWGIQSIQNTRAVWGQYRLNDTFRKRIQEIIKKNKIS